MTRLNLDKVVGELASTGSTAGAYETQILTEVSNTQVTGFIYESEAGNLLSIHFSDTDLGNNRKDVVKLESGSVTHEQDLSL